MSRTEDLRRGGARERGGGGGGAPFVKWPDRYAYVEGEVIEHWTGKYGDAVTLHVTAASEGFEATGKDEDGAKYFRPVTPNTEVNVGLNYSVLEGTIQPEDKGKHFHIAFEGWGETKNGDRYRLFAVLEVPRQGEQAQGNPAKAAAGGSPFDPDDDDLPF